MTSFFILRSLGSGHAGLHFEPMARLSAGDMSAALEFVGEANSFEDLEEFRTGILPGIQSLVPSDLVGYNEVDLGGGPALVLTHPDPLFAEAGEALARYAHEHPLISVQMNGDGRTYKISDFLSAKEFHSLDIYEQIYGKIGAEDQIAFGLPGPMVIGIAMNRPRRDFSERDRSLLDLLRPHLARAYGNLVERRQSAVLASAFEEGLDKLGAAVVLVEPGGRIVAASGLGMELIDAYFPAGWDGVSSLAASGGDPATVEGDRGRLRVSATAAAGDMEGTLLVLEEEPAVTVEALRALGLTDRQAEVLRLLAARRGTEEIAAALYISPHTVRKHLEHIYARLGVNRRDQAIAAALEVSRRAGRTGSSRPRR
jgi:DNA-binding CsgD family transcriptional regulator